MFIAWGGCSRYAVWGAVSLWGICSVGWVYECVSVGGRVVRECSGR